MSPICFFILFIALYGMLHYYFKQVNDYETLIQTRKMFRYIIPFVFLLLGIAVFPSTLKDVVTFVCIALLFSPIFIIIYNILMWRFGLRDFYDEGHIENMEYFTLYLRSFKDDNQNTAISKRIIELFYELFCPFAVGRPYELLPPKIGAPRLYLADDWQEDVLQLMEKAQIILLRISDTENFMWEYEQVIDNNYLSKTVFWIKDINALNTFIKGMKKEYSLFVEKLETESVGKESLAYFNNDEWTLFDNNHSKSFLCSYLSDHQNLSIDYKEYLYDNGHIMKHLFSFHYDRELMRGVPKWDWVSFAFPEFFILIHRIEKIESLFLLTIMDMWLVSNVIMVCKKTSIIECLLVSLFLILRFFVMFFMGRNARTVVWLGEKWESLDYFNKIYSDNNKKTLLTVAAVTLGAILLFII